MLHRTNDILFPKILESETYNTWFPILENYATGLTEEKKQWMSKLGHIQMENVNEDSSFGTAGMTTLTNTPGLGSPSFGSTLGGQANFHSGSYGSGDKWMSPLAISLQVAAKTVGFDVVNVIPISAPTGMVYYLDYIYADGKLDGTGNDNPLLFKIQTPSTFTPTKGAYYIATSNSSVANGATIDGANAARLQYVGRTRIEGYAIFKLLGTGTSTANVVTDTTTLKLADIFDGSATLLPSTDGTTATTGNTSNTYAVTGTADYVRAFEDQVYGFSNGEGGIDNVTFDGNFIDGQSLYEGALRGEAEAQQWKNMGVRIQSKNIETKTLKTAISITQEQMQDMKRQHGFDIVAKSESALVNELSQNINKNILARLYAMGWENHYNAYNAEGINYNLALEPTYTSATSVSYIGNGGDSRSLTVPVYQNYSGSTSSFENQETIQRRIVSKILGASDIIQQRGRRGPANFIVTNIQVASALRNASGYTFAPFSNTLKQTGGNLYPAGEIAGMTLYVDPNMKNTDTRVLVGRKGADDEPGLKFMPYLLGESVETISSVTMSPRIAVTSRFALVDYGRNPETQYFTFYVKTPTGGLV